MIDRINTHTTFAFCHEAEKAVSINSAGDQSH